MPDISMDFKDMIGHLFFDRAKNVPDSKQLSEDLVNSMYGTRFRKDAYRVVVLCAANLEDPDLQELGERLKICGRQLISRLTGECHDLLYHFDQLRVRLLLNYPEEKDDHILFLLRSQLQAVPPLHDGNAPATVGCSRLHDQIQDIKIMLDESSNIMWTRFASTEPILIHPASIPPCPPDILDIFANAEQEMKAACDLLDLDAFQKSLDAFFSQPDELIVRFETRPMIRRVEYYMFDVNRDLISAFTDASKASREMVLSLRTATSLPEYKRRYREYLVMLMQRIIDGSSAHLSRPIRQAQHYIQENCSRQLRLEEVAHHVGLTPVYLCARFKQELGIGFSDYCNQCRIEQAKVLLKDTQRPIVDIAQAVGYSGPRYFSRVFKELEGINPTQYRSAIRKA